MRAARGQLPIDRGQARIALAQEPAQDRIDQSGRVLKAQEPRGIDRRGHRGGVRVRGVFELMNRRDQQRTHARVGLRFGPRQHRQHRRRQSQVPAQRSQRDRLDRRALRSRHLARARASSALAPRRAPRAAPGRAAAAPRRQFPEPRWRLPRVRSARVCSSESQPVDALAVSEIRGAHRAPAGALEPFDRQLPLRRRPPATARRQSQHAPGERVGSACGASRAAPARS